MKYFLCAAALTAALTGCSTDRAAREPVPAVPLKRYLEVLEESGYKPDQSILTIKPDLDRYHIPTIKPDLSKYPIRDVKPRF